MGTLRFDTLTPSEVLQARMQGVRQARPEWTAEEAMRYSLAIDPPLARAYAVHPHSIKAANELLEGRDEAPWRKAIDAPAELVSQRVAAYRATHPAVSVEAAQRAVLNADPQLKELYAARMYAIAALGELPVDSQPPAAPGAASGVPAEQGALAAWHQAGQEVLRAADRVQQQSPGLSRAEAIHRVLRDNVELAHRYARVRTPPGP